MRYKIMKYFIDELEQCQLSSPRKFPFQGKRCNVWTQDLKSATWLGRNTHQNSFQRMVTRKTR